MARRKDLTGNVYGRLTVQSFAEINKHGSAVWNCECSCGAITKATTNMLAQGNTKSCGCLLKDKNKTHGLSKTPTWHSWKNMKDRCCNPNHYAFNDYGGRGIKIHEEWNSFESFLSDMGVKPSDKTLERVDNNKGYSPDNCVWASKTSQSRNRRPQKRNRFNVSGVTLDKTGKYRSVIIADRKQHYLGCFSDLFDAICARKSAENLYWGAAQ